MSNSYHRDNNISSMHETGNETVRDFSGLYHRAIASRKKRMQALRREGHNVPPHIVPDHPDSDQLPSSRLSFKNMLGFKDSVSPAPATHRNKKCSNGAKEVKLLIIDDSEATVNFFIKELIEKRSSTWSSYYPTVLANIMSKHSAAAVSTAATSSSSSSAAHNSKGLEQYILSENSELLKCVTVKTTNNGRDGLHYLRNEPFDVVFINLNVAMIYNDPNKDVHGISGSRSRSTTPTHSRKGQDAAAGTGGNSGQVGGGNRNSPGGSVSGGAAGGDGDLSGGVMTLKKWCEYLELDKQAQLVSTNHHYHNNNNNILSGHGVSKLQAAGATEKLIDKDGEEKSVMFTAGAGLVPGVGSNSSSSNKSIVPGAAVPAVVTTGLSSRGVSKLQAAGSTETLTDKDGEELSIRFAAPGSPLGILGAVNGGGSFRAGAAVPIVKTGGLSRSVSKLAAAGATETFTDRDGEAVSVNVAVSQKLQSAAGVEVSPPPKSHKNRKSWLNNLSQSNPKNVNYTRSEVATGTHVLTSAVSMKGSSTSVYTPHLSREFSIHSSGNGNSGSDYEHSGSHNSESGYFSENDGDDEGLINEHVLVIGMGEDCSDQQIATARKHKMHYYCEKPVEPIDLYSILGAVDFARKFDESQAEEEEAEGLQMALQGSSSKNHSNNNGFGSRGRSLSPGGQFRQRSGILNVSDRELSANSVLSGGSVPSPGHRRQPNGSPPPGMSRSGSGMGIGGSGGGSGSGYSGGYSSARSNISGVSYGNSPRAAAVDPDAMDAENSGSSTRRKSSRAMAYAGCSTDRSFRSSNSIMLDDLGSCNSFSPSGMISMSMSQSLPTGADTDPTATCIEEDQQLENIEAAAAVRHQMQAGGVPVPVKDRKSAPKSRYNPTSNFSEDVEFST